MIGSRVGGVPIPPTHRSRETYMLHRRDINVNYLIYHQFLEMPTSTDKSMGICCHRRMLFSHSTNTHARTNIHVKVIEEALHDHLLNDEPPGRSRRGFPTSQLISSHVMEATAIGVDDDAGEE